MSRNHFAAAAGMLFAMTSAAAQEPAAKPARPERLVEVAALGASTRAPSAKEIEALGLKVDVRPRGQVVTELAKDGAAAAAGIEPGDVLTQLDAVELYSQDDIADFLRASRPGQKVQVAVHRAKTGKDETVAVTLGKQELKEPDAPRLEWEFASLAQLGDALAKAKMEGKRVLVGLSGAET